MVKNITNNKYYDVEIIFTDGTSDLLNIVRTVKLNKGTQTEDILFISKDGSEIRIQQNKTILIMYFYSLDGKGSRMRIKPNIEYRKFNYVPKTEEERILLSKVDEMIKSKFDRDNQS